ncbi:MAG: ABC transporter permease subunit [Treponema sp.]|jgi:NitT/TauT family transport system permease protein|nr:ABC transporter permease subunit [Treponema sp.]
MSDGREELSLDVRQRIVNIPTLMFVALLVLVSAVPGSMAARTKMSSPVPFIAAVIMVELVFQFHLRDKKKRRTAKDICGIVFSFLIAWEIITTKLDLFPFIFVPAPENVFAVYVLDWHLIVTGFFRSMFLLFTGFSGSLFLGVALGIAVGWIPRLRESIFPIAKTISTVPAMIYGPYIVVIMPTFTSASIFVIFCGTFWSLFMNMINRVGTVDKRIINTAKVLNVKTRTMLFNIILPYTLPRIINDLTVSLSISIMTLTVAEMIGADRGMGFYVKRSLDYANYTQAFAGIFFIALVITFLNVLIALLRARLIKWSY